MKNSNVREYSIARDTLPITDAEYIVKMRVPKLLLECSIQQLHNELIASPDDVGLLGSRYSDTNDVVISDTMLCSLSPPQLRPMIDNQKMMRGCAICKTSNYFQKSLNACRQKQLKIKKDKVDNSRGRGKYELTQGYKSYAKYKFPNNETCHPHCENTAYSVLCTPTNDSFQFPNWKCVLRKCTACTSIALPAVDIYLSKQAPMITFNTYITQFTCSYHGILIREKITTYLDAIGESRILVFT